MAVTASTEFTVEWARTARTSYRVTRTLEDLVSPHLVPHVLTELGEGKSLADILEAYGELGELEDHHAETNHDAEIVDLTVQEVTGDGAR